MKVLTRSFVLVTKNGSIFEITTKFGGKMLQMLFVVIQNFFWWNYPLSTKRFSWRRGSLKQRIWSNMWLYKENQHTRHSLECFSQKSICVHLWTCSGLPNIRVVGLNSEWRKNAFTLKRKGVKLDANNGFTFGSKPFVPFLRLQYYCNCLASPNIVF